MVELLCSESVIILPDFTPTRYNIRIESSVREQLQLKERYWRICSLSGTLETVRGKGVIGQVGKIEEKGKWVWLWQRIRRGGAIG